MTPSCFMVSILTVFWIKGVHLSKEKQVFQTPTELFWKPNNEVILSLTHEIPSYDTILWYQRSAGDTSLKLIAYMYYKSGTVEPPFKSRFNVSGDGEKTAHLHLLSLSHPEDSGEYFGAAKSDKVSGTSEAYFGGGTKLTVLEPGLAVTGPTVGVLPPSPRECKYPKDAEWKKKTIVCVASGFYPDHVGVEWKIDGENVTEGVATDGAALRREKYYKITSRLRVSAEEWFTLGKKFTCIVSFFNGTHTELYENSVNGVKGKEGVLTREKYLRITQTAKFSYGVFIIKSSFYGAFVALLVWKLQRSGRKQND